MTSSYIRLLRECRNNKEVLIWADNCAGRSSSLPWFSVNTWGPDSVTLKYLQKGHTFMAADGLHGEIGKVLKKETQVVTFSDFVKVCSKASKKSKTIIMDLPDLYSFTKENRCRNSEKVRIPPSGNKVYKRFRQDVS